MGSRIFWKWITVGVGIALLTGQIRYVFGVVPATNWILDLFTAPGDRCRCADSVRAHGL